MSSQRIFPITQVSGKGIPLRGNDIDTDQIIPARFMKGVTFNGLGEFAFHDSRFDEEGAPKEHPFNNPRYKDGSILIVNGNFGCGSSREHAPQALMRYGVKAIVGESFAEIFAGNCTAMGVPVVQVSPAEVRELQATIEEAPETTIHIDLTSHSLAAGPLKLEAALPEAYRNALLSGTWDSTAVMLANTEKICKTAQSLPYMRHFQ